jgi:hypothetical protein
MLLPKQLIEQANVITLNENNNIIEDEQIEDNQSDISDNNEQISVTDIIKTPYISQGNVVRCVTGSFD